jgi:hypothetical protein
MVEEKSQNADWVPQTQPELMEAIQREWRALMRTVAELGAEQMIRANPGEWSIKDHLAHLAEWEQYLLRYHLGGEAAHVVLGVAEAEIESLGEDGLNAVIFQRNRHRSFDDVMRGLRRSHREVLEVLEKTPFQELLKPRYADDPDQRPALNWVIGNTCDHYREHRAAIRGLATR